MATSYATGQLREEALVFRNAADRGRSVKQSSGRSESEFVKGCSTKQQHLFVA